MKNEIKLISIKIFLVILFFYSEQNELQVFIRIWENIWKLCFTRLFSEYRKYIVLILDWNSIFSFRWRNAWYLVGHCHHPNQSNSLHWWADRSNWLWLRFPWAHLCRLSLANKWHSMKIDSVSNVLNDWLISCPFGCAPFSITTSNVPPTTNGCQFSSQQLSRLYEIAKFHSWMVFAINLGMPLAYRCECSAHALCLWSSNGRIATRAIARFLIVLEFVRRPLQS